jgi:alpha-tubulin suppressor-like RCC1 family protein
MVRRVAYFFNLTLGPLNLLGCGLFDFPQATRVECGDGKVHTEFGETCDLGRLNNDDKSACSSACELQEVLAVAAGGNHTCARVSTKSGEKRLRCWGANGSGQLGLGDTMARGVLPGQMGSGLMDVPLGDDDIESVALGSEHTCVILGEGGVRCWGNGSSLRLGGAEPISFGDAPERPVSDAPLVELGGRKAIALALGKGHSCTLLEASGSDPRQVMCWGEGYVGQLGDGSMDVSGPKIVKLVNSNGASLDVRAVVAGLWHTCALTDAGVVYCWGDGSSGQVGQETLAPSFTPVEVHLGMTSVKVKQIAAGDSHTCALFEGKSAIVKCWGLNDEGQLGLGDRETRGDELNDMHSKLPPVQVEEGVSTIAAGGNRTCAVREDQSLTCWGDNTDGLLGLGDEIDRLSGIGPRVDLGKGLAFADGKAIGLVLGQAHACAMVNNGSVRCWGANFSGQLGLERVSPFGDEPDDMAGGLPPVRLFSDVW